MHVTWILAVTVNITAAHDLTHHGTAALFVTVLSIINSRCLFCTGLLSS
jgi:hypothetical protein